MSMESKATIRVLVTFHSQSGNTRRMAEAVASGVNETEGAEAVLRQARDTADDDIRGCHALVICSPEYFGYMAGAIKDLFDRTYEQLREDPAVHRKPYALVISAGNDGTGALAQIERILKGYRLKKAQHPIIAKGPITDGVLSACVELGKIVAEGVKAGIF